LLEDLLHCNQCIHRLCHEIPVPVRLLSPLHAYKLTWAIRKSEYETESDIDKPFPVLTLIIPCFLFALFFNYLFTVTEVLWAFSIYLEAVAIIPQIVVLLRTEDGQSLIQPYYLIALGLYRAIYGLNWIYRSAFSYRLLLWVKLIFFRYETEGLFDPIAILGGLVQTSLYIYFFWVYFVRYGIQQSLTFFSANLMIRL